MKCDIPIVDVNLSLAVVVKEATTAWLEKMQLSPEDSVTSSSFSMAPISLPILENQNHNGSNWILSFESDLASRV
ncbi:unnamed protein product [Ilex paraguariensis]|uniref:Uncharacterized protein n=1 Tax=Ilex paraguariensis TaxID=185542 RepID=A0ABC8U010_9AQUA